MAPRIKPYLHKVDTFVGGLGKTKCGRFVLPSEIASGHERVTCLLCAGRAKSFAKTKTKTSRRRWP